MPETSKLHHFSISHISVFHKVNRRSRQLWKTRWPRQLCSSPALIAATLVTAVCLIATSCDNANFIRPQLLTTPELIGSKQFAVINQNYVKAFAETNTNSTIVTLLRGGDVVRIVGRSAAQERQGAILEYWYQIQANGKTAWIYGGLLDQYGLEMQAKTAAEIVRAQLFNPVQAATTQATAKSQGNAE